MKTTTSLSWRRPNSQTATQSQSVADAIDARVLVVAGYDASLSHGVAAGDGRALRRKGDRLHRQRRNPVHGN